MQFRDQAKFGSVTMELALSLFSIVLVLLVVFNTISENFKTMASSTNFKNLTTENSAKTSYATYNRDYTDSTVYVK